MAKTIQHHTIGLTGARGFIGSHVLDYFRSLHLSVIPFQGDLLCEEDINKYFDMQKIDQIVHLVGAVSGSPEYLYRINYLTTENLLRVGVPKGLKKIVYASSVKVYGDSLNTICSEANALFPDTYYGLYKVFSEEVIKYFSRRFGLRYVILRLSNIYGSGNKTGVMYDFETDIRTNKTVTIIGSGKQKRNLVHINDACVGIEKAIYYEKNDVFNIASPLPYSILDIVNEFQKKYTFSIKHAQADETAHDLLASTDKAEALLHFKTSIRSLRI